MNGKKGSCSSSSSSVAIEIPSVSKPKQLEDGKSNNNSGTWVIIISVQDFIRRVWEFGKEDSNRVIFSLKVGLAVLLVSLLILCQAPYDVFGNSIIWSILTVAIMFEYTVGATFNRGFNRALGSLLAGLLAIAVAQIAIQTGRVAAPVIIGISIFIIGTLTSFMKLWPSLVPYEYGFRVILFTYCLIIVSGHRMGNPIKTAMDRLYSIAIGAFIAVIVNVLVFPIWAGEQLHKELVKSFESVADSLEECVKKYLEDDGSQNPEFSKTVMDEFLDEPAYRKCKATLNSSAKLESLANSAKWEPPHGRFQHFFYPWSEYVKVGAVLRYCAYEVMALHGVLHSEIQAPYNLRITFKSEIEEATNQAAELVRSLGKDISNMRRTFKSSLLKRVHGSSERLQRAIDMHSYLLTSNYDHCSNTQPPPLPKLSKTQSTNMFDVSSNQSAELDSNTNSLEKFNSGEFGYSYNDMLVRKQSKRQHSWPSREVDSFEEERGCDHVAGYLPRMRALESTTALSLANFTSLLIEFVARLDHLVEAVDELSKLAKFKREGPVKDIKVRQKRIPIMF